MLKFREYVRAESLEDAYVRNQKKSAHILGGMLWLKMQNRTVQTVIDLSDLGLSGIEETEEEYRIGAMTSLRELELHKGLDAMTGGAVRESLRHIVGVQFRNLATVGGSIFGRFGFSDVLTMFLALDSWVELYHGGLVPMERFAAEALETLGELFVGKSGIFDHQWTAEGQTARIYRTEMVREGAQVTAAGDGYCWLKAWAYLLRTEKNADLIAEIEGGIKREVSVGCSVARRVCSICGAEGGTCQHTPGQRYGEQLCYLELREPTDAYEWSFVVVPAQRKAGVLKRYGHENQGMAQLRAQAELGRKYLRELRREVTRLAMLADDSMDGGALAKAAEHLEEPELLELKRVYGAQAARRFPPVPQLRSRGAAKTEDETEFLI